MDDLSAKKQYLDGLRPLSRAQVDMLWPHWRTEDALFVYATNAIEGSTFTLGETTVVLETGVTIGGKPLQDHIDAVNGAKAYALMLDFAQKRVDLTLEDVLELHRAVVGKDNPIAGEIRAERVSIRGSQHVPPNYMRVPRLLDEMMERYHASGAHAVDVASRLHFDLLTIHPFKDGNRRTSRLLHNLHLIREGYAPILIDPQEKAKYFDVLNAAQTAVPGIGDPLPFLRYMADLERTALDRYAQVLHQHNDRTTQDAADWEERRNGDRSTLTSGPGAFAAAIGVVSPLRLPRSWRCRSFSSASSRSSRASRPRGPSCRLRP